MRPKAALFLVCDSPARAANRACLEVGAPRIVLDHRVRASRSIARFRRFHPIQSEYSLHHASLSDMLIRWIVTGAPMRPAPSFIDSTPERTR